MKIQGKQLNIPQGKVLVGTADSNGAASDYTFPASDGSANQILQTNGSGALSFVDQSSGTAADDITLGNAAVTIATDTGNITIDAQADNSDIIFKGTDGGSDITMLTLDGSSGGTAIFNHDISLANDGALLKFGVNSDVYLQHLHDTGLTFFVSSAGNDEPKFTFTNSVDVARGPQIEMSNYQIGTDYDNGDVLGSIEFQGNLTSNTSNKYSMIEGLIADKTSNSQTGELSLLVMKGGSSNFSSALRVVGNASNGSTVDVVDHDGSAEGLKLGGNLVTSTAAEINFLDTSAKSPSSGQVLSYNGSSLAWATVGGGGVTYSAITADPNTAQTGYHYSCGAGNQSFTVSLPAVASTSAGEEIRIKNMGTGTITVSSNGSEEIDTSTSDYLINIQFASITLVSTGSAWEIV